MAVLFFILITVTSLLTFNASGRISMSTSAMGICPLRWYLPSAKAASIRSM